MRWRSLIAGWGSVVLISGIHAEEAVAPEGFGPPAVTKLDWDTRSLRVADLNGDGLNDLILVNNDRGRIDFLLQRGEDEPLPPSGRPVRKNRWEPVLEDALFREENLVTGFPLFAVVAGDFNHDGRTDVAYTASETPLSIQYQLDDGGFAEAVVFDGFQPRPWTSTLKVGDVDGDGKTDLLVLGQEEILLFRHDEEGLSTHPDRLRMAATDAYGIDLADINRDGRPDIVYASGTDSQAWRIRLQEDSGKFGAERAFDLRIGPGIVHLLERGESGQAPIFAYIAQHSGMINLFELRRRENSDAGFESTRPLIYPVSAGSEPASYAYGDFDGDGIGELAVADPTESSILVYRQEADWKFQPPQSFPSLLGTSELVVAPREEGAGDDLAVFSGEENFAGLSRMTGEGRLAFPVPFPVEGEIQTVASGWLLADETPKLFFVTKEDREHHMVVLERGGDHPSGYRLLHEAVIPGVKRSPEGIVVFDLNGDGWSEILLLAPREPARIFRLAEQKAEEGHAELAAAGQEEVFVLTELASGSSVRKSLLDDLPRNRLGYGDVNEDGNVEMIVAADGFARAVGLDDEDRFVILDQFNARVPGDSVQIPAVLDTDGDGVEELLFYEASGGTLQRLARDENEVLRYRDSAEVGKIDVRGVRVHNESPTPRLLVFGADRFWVLPLSGGEWKKVEIASHETDLLDVSPTELALPSAALGPPHPIVAVDGRSNVIELLEWTPPDKWSSRLHFTVFEKNLHYRGRTGAPHEPREVLLEDLTGDGIPDLVTLVHDRILVYPGQ